MLSHQLIGFVVYRAPLLPVLYFGCLWGGIASPNMHLVLLCYLIFRLLPVFLESCSLLLLLRVVFVVSVHFLIFVLVVCSPLLLSGWFAGARTFVVLDLSFVAGIFRTLSLLLLLRVVFVVSVYFLFPNFCTCSLLAVAVVVWVACRCSALLL